MTDSVRAIADACLYEGYILWPYRRSALKNQRRFTFGGVYPPKHSEEHPDDRSVMQTELLLRGGPNSRIEDVIEVHFSRPRDPATAMFGELYGRVEGLLDEDAARMRQDL